MDEMDGRSQKSVQSRSLELREAKVMCMDRAVEGCEGCMTVSV